jgi:hypothetical protein
MFNHHLDKYLNTCSQSKPVVTAPKVPTKSIASLPESRKLVVTSNMTEEPMSTIVHRLENNWDTNIDREWYMYSW